MDSRFIQSFVHYRNRYRFRILVAANFHALLISRAQCQHWLNQLMFGLRQTQPLWAGHIAADHACTSAEPVLPRLKKQRPFTCFCRTQPDHGLRGSEHLDTQCDLLCRVGRPYMYAGTEPLQAQIAATCIDDDQASPRKRFVEQSCCQGGPLYASDVCCQLGCILHVTLQLLRVQALPNRQQVRLKLLLRCQSVVLQSLGQIYCFFCQPRFGCLLCDSFQLRYIRDPLLARTVVQLLLAFTLEDFLSCSRGSGLAAPWHLLLHSFVLGPI